MPAGVPVTGGGFDDCTKPEQPEIATLKHSTASVKPPSQARLGTLVRAILNAASTLIISVPSTNHRLGVSGLGRDETGGVNIPLAVVLTATLTLAALPFTATLPGAVHVAPFGAPVQLMVTLPVNPASGVTFSA